MGFDGSDRDGAPRSGTLSSPATGQPLAMPLEQLVLFLLRKVAQPSLRLPSPKAFLVFSSLVPQSPEQFRYKALVLEAVFAMFCEVPVHHASCWCI